MAAKFKYEMGAKVKHKTLGLGEINARITIKGKILLKDTYNVAFLEHGTKTVKEKDLKKATIEEWTTRFKTP